MADKDSEATLFTQHEKKNFFIPGVLSEKKDFDGPLDLLLYLISENNANIYDLPIALITDQFLAYINEADLEDLSDFYRMGAELLYIKTKLLLPQITELEDKYEDPRSDLVDRLLDYQKFRRLTDLLTGIDSGDRLYISRPENLFAIPYEDKEIFKDVDLSSLLATFSEILKRTPPSKIFNVYQEVSVKEKEALISELLDKEETITIDDIIIDRTNPLHVICAFMAILQGAKDHILLFMQKESNGVIYIFKRPEDFTKLDVDKIDREADNITNKSNTASDVNILHPNLSLSLDEMVKQNENKTKDEDIFIGEEEEISLDDDE